MFFVWPVGLLWRVALRSDRGWARGIIIRCWPGCCCRRLSFNSFLQRVGSSSFGRFVFCWPGGAFVVLLVGSLAVGISGSDFYPEVFWIYLLNFFGSKNCRSDFIFVCRHEFHVFLLITSPRSQVRELGRAILWGRYKPAAACPALSKDWARPQTL